MPVDADNHSLLISNVKMGTLSKAIRDLRIIRTNLNRTIEKLEKLRVVLGNNAWSEISQAEEEDAYNKIVKNLQKMRRFRFPE